MNDFDFYDDGGALLNELGLLDRLPDSVKQAAFAGDLESADYALVISDGARVVGKYPCHDTGNTILSTVYFMNKHASLTDEATKVAASNLGAALLGFGMDVPAELLTLAGAQSYTDLEQRSPFVSEARKSQEELQKEAGVDDIFAAVKDYNDQFNHMPAHVRMDLAERLIPLAEAHGAQMCKQAQTYAHGVPDVEKAIYSVRQRKWFSQDPIYDEIEKIAHVVSPADLPTIIAEADYKTGLFRQWDGRLEDPLLSVLKVAESNEVVHVGHMTVTLNDLRHLADNFKMLRDHFGETFALSFKKDQVAVFKSLPDPTKEILARMSRDEN